MEAKNNILKNDILKTELSFDTTLLKNAPIEIKKEKLEKKASQG